MYNVYRSPLPGLEPSDALLIGRTTATTFQDVPPQDGEVPYYLVLAQHGALADPVDSTERGSAQVIRWVPKIPTLARTLLQSWDFESGAQSWTAQNFFDLSGPWVRVTPHGTRYGDVQFAPDEASGGAGFAWVTGDAVSADSIAERDADGGNLLLSPMFDGRNGATYFSFDYWAHIGIYDALTLRINNGSQEVVASPVQYLTVQTFDSPARYGWQRAEVDLARDVTPTATMRVTFVPSVSNALSEFGVDNVRVERATGCARAAPGISSVAVDDTPAGWGNGNGVLDPGETARLTLTLLNGGTATALSASATISSPTAGVLVHEATSSFANIPPSSTGSSTGPAFTVTVPGSEGCGDTATFEFDVTEATGTRVTLPWSPETGLTITDQVFADTFETDKGWIAQGGRCRGRPPRVRRAYGDPSAGWDRIEPSPRQVGRHSGADLDRVPGRSDPRRGGVLHRPRLRRARLGLRGGRHDDRALLLRAARRRRPVLPSQRDERGRNERRRAVIASRGASTTGQPAALASRGIASYLWGTCSPQRRRPPRSGTRKRGMT